MSICDDLDFLDIFSLSGTQIQDLEFVVGDSGVQGIMRLEDILPLLDPLSVPVGFTVDFYGSAIPDGWLLLDGSSFSAITYPKLFEHLGVNQLPDYQGKTTEGATLTPNTTGTILGNDELVLSASQMAAHSHSYVDTTGQLNLVSRGDSSSSKFESDNMFKPSSNPVENDKVTDPTGNSTPLSNLQPQVIVRKLIKAE